MTDQHRPGQLRVAADIGGTFTDIAFITEDGAIATRKVPSTPADFAAGVTDGIAALASSLGHGFADYGEVLHACTVATNAILEHKGAKTALITTRGFRDVLEMRRVRVPRLYEPLYEKPKPLVPRWLRLEVTERMGPKGEIILPLAQAEIDAAITALRQERVEAVAVCLLHSYANPDHERRIGERLRAALPDAFVSLSIDVLPQLREYERTSTTVINAYVGPPVERYLRSLQHKLAQAGSRARLLVMQSGGGVANASAAIAKPAQIVECGPAAGVIGAAKLGALTGYDRLITLDMGGTTAKASIVEHGRLKLAEDYEVGGGISLSGPLVMGGGYALKLPVLDIAEVGAGGGSIVWIDQGGGLRVGPHSAGADPGPACYGRGGREPTVTDANVVLGYLNPRAIAGGSVKIDANAAASAIRERIAGRINGELIATALGIHTLANVSMVRAVKTVSTYRGRDPREFALFAFGGSGGVHAVNLARALGMTQIIFPPAAGVFSALGLLLADIELSESQAFLCDTAELHVDQLRTTLAELEERVLRLLARPRNDVRFRHVADMRFRGQAYELPIAIEDTEIGTTLGNALKLRFTAEHLRTYGFGGTGDLAVQIVSLRAIGTVRDTGQRRFDPHRAMHRSAHRGDRPAYFDTAQAPVATAIIDRGDLSEAWSKGPFIVEEYEATLVVPPGARARLDEFGSILVDVTQ